jgi:hypothetical protein
MAFCKPDTNKAFFAAFADTKEFMLTRSLISAGAIIASHISTNSLSAISANMGTLNAGKIQLSDSNDMRIYIDGDASTPVIKISKDGYEADSETDPDNLLFSSIYNYLKVVETGYTECAFADPGSLASHGYYSEDIEITLTSTTGDARAVMGFTGIAGGYVFAMPYEKAGASMLHREMFSILYDDSGSGRLLVRRELYNYDSSAWDPSSATQWVRWYLFAETIT